MLQFDASGWPYNYGHLINITGTSSSSVVAQLYLARAGKGVFYRYQLSNGNLSAWVKLAFDA